MAGAVGFAEGRSLNFVRRQLPQVLRRLAELEPLIRAGVVRLFPWEVIYDGHAAHSQLLVRQLVADPDFEKVATRPAE